MIRCGSSPYLECSSKGDKRFSAFYATIRNKNGRSIEDLYQGFKVFKTNTGGTVTNLSWREAKGKLATNQEEAAKYYSELWDTYIMENPHLLEVLRQANGLSDMFGQPGRCCQAIELFRIRNTF